MDDLAEKRIFHGREGARVLLAATEAGVVRVNVANGRVGEYGLALRCVPADVVASAGRLAIATDEDVLLAQERDVEALEATGFGPAISVTFHRSRSVALSPDGRLGVRGGDDWDDRGQVPADPTALDGGLIATDDGVFRLVDDGLVAAGLTDVNDVAHAAGVPLAATVDGLYELGNGWLDVLEGDVRIVAGTPDGRAHAATVDAVYERRSGGAWGPVALPTDERVVDISHDERAYAVTASGDLLLETDDGWRLAPLGLPTPVALAVL